MDIEESFPRQGWAEFPLWRYQVRAASIGLLRLAALVIVVGGCTTGPDFNAVDPVSMRKHVESIRQYQNGRSETEGVTLAAGVETGASATTSIGTSIKEGFGKFADFITPKTPVRTADDPTSLNNKAKPSVELYTAIATQYAKSDKFGEAEKNYQKALRLKPRHLPALVGWARLKDRQGQMDDAVALYQRAVKAHPDDASVLNDLGLCFARAGKFKESISALERAAKLQPKRKLYRNNLATVLVEKGEVDKAYMHLRTVHEEAIAHYNLGYLLQKKGQSRLAAAHFAGALEKDPSLNQARTWLERLGTSTAEALAETASEADAGRSVESQLTPAPSDRVVRRPTAVVEKPPGLQNPVRQPDVEGTIEPQPPLEVIALPPVTEQFQNAIPRAREFRPGIGSAETPPMPGANPALRMPSLNAAPNHTGQPETPPLPGPEFNPPGTAVAWPSAASIPESPAPNTEPAPLPGQVPPLPEVRPLPRVRP